ncbi:unnamed protein product [Moneuplotes crassus]|uniref:LITAF domain-containing protein n=1 Tax=Euplotes crassus TaxID=5936 RepID=A0AAD1Y2V0_EUPCR|nr:unnamed protein product [Moneuplotes crassus]
MNTPNRSEDDFPGKYRSNREYLETIDPAELQRQYDEEQYHQNFILFGHSKIATTADEAVQGEKRPVLITCPICGKKDKTVLKRVKSPLQWCICFLCCILIVCIPCCWVPFKIKGLFAYRHQCAHCNYFIGKAI